MKIGLFWKSDGKFEIKQHKITQNRSSNTWGGIGASLWYWKAGSDSNFQKRLYLKTESQPHVSSSILPFVTWSHLCLFLHVCSVLTPFPNQLSPHGCWHLHRIPLPSSRDQSKMTKITAWQLESPGREFDWLGLLAAYEILPLPLHFNQTRGPGTWWPTYLLPRRGYAIDSKNLSHSWRI